MGTYGAKEVLWLARNMWLFPEKLILWVIGEKAYRHNQGKEQENDPPNLPFNWIIE